MRECPGYDAFIDECRRVCRCCRCCRGICDGVQAGNMCDEQDCLWDDHNDERCVDDWEDDE